MRLAIRANGNRRAGLGHLGRCMALAQAFRERGRNPVFLGLDGACARWVRSHGFGTRPLGSGDWDILIADSYEFTDSDLLWNRRHGRTLLVVDDFGTSRAPCDWLLSSHVYAPGLDFHATAAAGLLIGPKFHLMRREYWTPARPRRISGRIREVLVTLGGGDGWGLAERVVRELLETLPAARLHLLLGPLAPETPPSFPSRVALHRGLLNLRPLIEACDAALTAGGQMLYELAFAGTPTVALNLGRDQNGNIAGMTAAGATLSVGQPDMRGFLPRLRAAFRKLDRSPRLRRELGARAGRILDGQGARRVARLLLEDRP